MLIKIGRSSFQMALAAIVTASLACSVATTFNEAPPSPTVSATGDTAGVTATAAAGLPSPTPASATVNAPGTPLPTLTVAPTSESQVITSQEQQLIALYAKVNPSVVSILVELGDSGGAQGTGFVFDTEGHVVTNQHVVEGATSIEVDFPSGLKLTGRVLGADPDSDLAVIAVDGLTGSAPPLPLANSDDIQVGESVVAIGNPFGLAGTMTVGIVSGLGRTVSSNRTAPSGGAYTAPDIIQTDAAINPGNSGGPLLNLAGEVIGINKALESQTGVNSGVGFAIASNTIRQIVPYLIKDGKFIYPYLGMSAQEEISLAMQRALNLPQATGVYVGSVVPGGPSDQAGLKGDSASGEATSLAGDGDLIVAINGREVKVFSELMSYLVNSTRPDQVITLSVLRGGQPMDLQVTLGARP